MAEPAPVRVPIEQTYTFHKATAETMYGITKKRDGKDTVITSLNAGGAAASCGLAVGDAEEEAEVAAAAPGEMARAR